MKTSTTTMQALRLVLENVPPVSYVEHKGQVELCPFPACLKACLEYLGERVTYEYLMGTSGAAFRLLWHPDKWDGGNVDTLSMAEDALEPHRRAFEAIGYSYEIVGNEGYATMPDLVKRFDQVEKQKALLNRLLASIQEKRRPLIAFGVIGPPECCLITGYDEGGEVLIGWNFFQLMLEFHPERDKEPSGYFRKRNWYPYTLGLIVLGDKIERRPQAEIHREALRWALEIASTAKVFERIRGFEAYTAWAEALLKDAASFAVDDLGPLYELYAVHNDAMTMVAEGRWAASRFLASIAQEEAGMAAALYGAAACYAAEHDLMHKIWDILGGAAFSEIQARNLARAEIRRQIVPLILQAREKDIEAAAYIERALASD